MPAQILEFNRISKEYSGNAVLKDISFSVAPGEIHGVIGENGAGKSTIMNILFGMPVIFQTGGFRGTVNFDDKPVCIRSPFEAMALGIGMVHQEFMLIPEMNVFENIKLNREPTHKNPLSWLITPKLDFLNVAKMRDDAKKSLTKVGVDIDIFLPIAGLPVGHMQFIEIARELDKENIKLLVFDEPTAVFTEVEADRLLTIMNHLAKDLGIAILFITHRLDEIERACDAITILRDGELVGNYRRGEISVDEMAELMVGRKVVSTLRRKNRESQKEIHLELKDFSVEMPGEEVHHLCLHIFKGEILGIGGLAGQGKIGIANGISGLFPARGQALKDSVPLPLNDPQKILAAGIAFLSEDRKGTGLILEETICENITLPSMQIQKRFLWKGILEILGFKHGGEIKKHVDALIEELDIRCVNRKQRVGSLSGGNQQKVCFARALTLMPEILLVSEPTRGVDIGAKKLILDKIVDLNETFGMTIVLTSSELMELRSVCDRIAIVSEGKICRILSPDASAHDFGLALAGEPHHGLHS